MDSASAFHISGSGDAFNIYYGIITVGKEYRTPYAPTLQNFPHFRPGPLRPAIPGTKAGASKFRVFLQGNRTAKEDEVWPAGLPLPRRPLQTPWSLLGMDLQSQIQNRQCPAPSSGRSDL